MNTQTIEMSANPMVSTVIITCRRKPDILKRALESAVNQTYKNQEIIIVNDAPEQTELEKRIREMIFDFDDDRIKYLVHEKNSGACKARNTGILNSKGDFIALLDDDDEWMPEKTEKQLKGFTSEKTGMVYSAHVEQFSDGRTKEIVTCNESGNLLKPLLYKNCIGGCSMPLIRKEVFDKCGLFDEELLSLQDYDMWLRIAKEYHINYVPGVLVRKYTLSDSITGNFQKKKQGYEKIWEKHGYLYKNNPEAFNSRMNREAAAFLKNKEYRLFFSKWMQAVKAKPLSSMNVTEPVRAAGKLLMGKR